MEKPLQIKSHFKGLSAYFDEKQNGDVWGWWRCKKDDWPWGRQMCLQLNAWQHPDMKQFRLVIPKSFSLMKLLLHNYCYYSVLEQKFRNDELNHTETAAAKLLSCKKQKSQWSDKVAHLAITTRIFSKGQMCLSVLICWPK